MSAGSISSAAQDKLDAARWRAVCEKAWLVDAAAWAYALRIHSSDPTIDADDVRDAVDAEILAARAAPAGTSGGLD